MLVRVVGAQDPGMRCGRVGSPEATKSNKRMLEVEIVLVICVSSFGSSVIKELL